MLMAPASRPGLAVLVGALSDVIGRKKTFLLSRLPGCFAARLLPGLAKAVDTTTIALYALAIAFLGQCGYAPVLFPQRAVSDRTACQRNRPVLEYRICARGMMPTFVSLASAGRRRSDVAGDLRSGDLCNLPGRCSVDPGDKGDFR